MDFKTFLENFDAIAEAPGGIPKLRSLILDLAVRGKLVPQNPEDEPASVLIGRIREKRKSFYGKHKDKINQSASDENETIFEAPEGWQWVTWADVGICQNGRAFPSKEYSTSGIKLLRPGNLHISGKLEWTQENTRYLPNIYAENYRDFIVSSNELIMNLTAQSLKDDFLGRICLTDESEYCLLNQRLARITPIGFLETFCLLLFKSPLFRQYVDGLNQGTLIQHMYTSQVYSFRFPLPPLAEQKRIVEKVDELMGLCDRYEAAKQTRDNLRQKLRESAIASLMNAETDEELDAAWAFVRDNWYNLSQNPEDVSGLRKSVLELAVRGKLVPQNSDEETAKSLQQKIQRIKEQALKEKKIQKDKEYSSITSAIPPWEIPSSWIWIRLQDAFEITRGGSPRPSGDPQFFGGDIPWITVFEITKDTRIYLTSTTDTLTELGSQRSRFIYPDDLLLTNSGATLGVPKISKIRGCINDGVAKLFSFHQCIYKEYAYYYLLQQTPIFRKVNQGMGQPNLNTSIIAGWFFSLPPLAEQKRIVAKVDELMQLCDQLEVSLHLSQKRAESLAASAISHLTI